jgi:glucose-1-phosphate thymidylyltransferase
VKAIILAAGYATRLYPLTQTISKMLLPLAGKPMLDYLLDKIRVVDEIDEIHLVTNHKFADSFLRWAAAHETSGLPIVVHDDGTTSEDGRLGAIGDVQFVIERAVLEHEDLLVIAGDNLFEFSLADFVAWWYAKGEASAVTLYDVGDLSLVSKYSNVELDDDNRIVGFIEKPEHPTSTLVATAAYIYHRDHVPLVKRYLDDGNVPDQPGRFIAWLCERVPVYGYVTDGDWRDIGDADQLLEADNALRERVGMSTRQTYALD